MPKLYKENEPRPDEPKEGDRGEIGACPQCRQMRYSTYRPTHKGSSTLMWIQDDHNCIQALTERTDKLEKGG